MSERLTDERATGMHGNCEWDASDGLWWYCPNGNGQEQVVSFDPEDGTRLNADGTVTERVDAVPQAALDECLTALMDATHELAAEDCPQGQAQQTERQVADSEQATGVDG